MKLLYSILLFTFIFSSCSDHLTYHYAIKDFRKKLQPSLQTIVTKGCVGYDTATLYLKKYATVKELKQLTSSEHPVLRITALYLLIGKEKIDLFSLMMLHLDDTANVVVDLGECWARSRFASTTVSDELLTSFEWKTEEARAATIDKVLTNHTYLNAAYTVLDHVKGNEKYHEIIRQMTQVDKPFSHIEMALYALAKYKKKEDIPLIKKILLENSWRLEYTSFRVIEEYPDPTYMEILKNYFKKRFYRYACDDEPLDYPNANEYFLNTLASYKNEGAQEIFMNILKQKTLLPCPGADTLSLKNHIYYAIWNNRCEQYSALLKKVEPYITESEKDRIYVDPVPISLPGDTTPPVFRWLW